MMLERIDAVENILFSIYSCRSVLFSSVNSPSVRSRLSFGKCISSVSSELEVRWLGRPGADFGIDRNPRMPAPLAVGGRLFHQGMNRMVALDAFNGAILWSLEIPDLRRVNIPRDCAADSSLI